MPSAAEIILKVLQNSADTAIDFIELAGSGVDAPRVASRVGSGSHFNQDWAELYRERQKFYSTLNRLKRAGLVAKIDQGNRVSSRWRITTAGLKFLSEKKGRVYSNEKRKNHKSAYPILFIFDIPEDMREERRWVRDVLKSFDYHGLQKSVWIGERPLPIEFFKDLRKKDLMRYVHIFSVFQQGTLGEP